MNRRTARLIAGLLALLVAVFLCSIWREVQQEKLNRALITAIKAADVQTVRSLLDRGADPDTVEAPQREVSVWGWLRDRWRGRSRAHPDTPALILAMTKVPTPDQDKAENARFLVMVKALLERGARVDVKDANGVGVFNLAVDPDTCFDVQVLQLLAEHRGNVDPWFMQHQPPLLDWKSPLNGCTALIAAAAWGEPDQINLLLGAGANIDLQGDDGLTALMCAVDHGRPENIACLLAHHPNLRLKDREGDTALSMALANQKTKAETSFSHEAGPEFWPNIVSMLEKAEARERTSRVMPRSSKR